MIAGAMLFMAVLNRVWPQEKRQVHNDLIGWQLNIIGTTYAVILGFMLYTVWTDFGSANLNVDLEASALRNVYRLAEGLPDAQRIKLQDQCHAYAFAVLNDDWPAMAKSQVPEDSHEINQAMWETLMSVKSRNAIRERRRRPRTLRTKFSHRTSPHPLAPKRIQAPHHILGRPSYRSTPDHHLCLHVRLCQLPAPRASGLFLHSPHHSCAARRGRRQSTFPRMGPCQQLRLRPGAGKYERVGTLRIRHPSRIMNLNPASMETPSS